MPFAQINCFNHTDPTNHTTAQKDMAALDNQYWYTTKKDRIIAICPTKGPDLQPTENTKYGRSELREFDPVTGKKTAVKITQYPLNVIAVRQAILDLGPEGKGITIQWHGSSTRPLGKGQWYYDDEDDSFYLNVQVAETFKAKEKEFILVKGVKKGQVFDLLFAFTATTFTAAFNWMDPAGVVAEVPINGDKSYSKDTGLYSKTGIYCQTDITVPYASMRPGQGEVALFEVWIYHNVALDFKHIDLDKTAFWRVGEVFTLDAPERKGLPPIVTPTPPKVTPVDPETLLGDLPVDQIQVMRIAVSQIQGNLSRGAKKTAITNLEKLKASLDTLPSPQGTQLQMWCKDQLDLLK